MTRRGFLLGSAAAIATVGLPLAAQSLSFNGVPLVCDGPVSDNTWWVVNYEGVPPEMLELLGERVRCAEMLIKKSMIDNMLNSSGDEGCGLQCFSTAGTES